MSTSSNLNWYNASRHMIKQENLLTAMIDKGCYDWTLKWLMDTNALQWDKIPEKTCSLGNCYHNEVSYVNNEGITYTKPKDIFAGEMLTGQSEAGNLNNIYDLTGLAREIIANAAGTNFLSQGAEITIYNDTKYCRIGMLL